MQPKKRKEKEPIEGDTQKRLREKENDERTEKRGGMERERGRRKKIDQSLMPFSPPLAHSDLP